MPGWVQAKCSCTAAASVPCWLAHATTPLVWPLPPTPPVLPTESAKEVLRENVSMPLLMKDLLCHIPILRPLKVGGSRSLASGKRQRGACCSGSAACRWCFTFIRWPLCPPPCSPPPPPCPQGVLLFGPPGELHSVEEWSAACAAACCCFKVETGAPSLTSPFSLSLRQAPARRCWPRQWPQQAQRPRTAAAPPS